MFAVQASVALRFSQRQSVIVSSLEKENLKYTAADERKAFGGLLR